MNPWTDDTIDLAPGRTLPVRVYGRAGAAAPLILHLHGGAFGPGSLDSGRPVATVLAGAGAVVVAADYPCGRGHPFPEALETAFLALCQMQTSRRRRPKLFVAGEEAGGNLAAALALVARDRREPALAGQILLSPMLDPRLATCSFRTAEAGPAGCKWADGWHDYLGSPEKACHPYAAPASALRLSGVARALLLTGPDDPMQDETETYAARLRDSHVPVTCRRVLAGPAWPDALMDPAPAGEPLWAAEIRAAVTDFLQVRGEVP